MSKAHILECPRCNRYINRVRAWIKRYLDHEQGGVVNVYQCSCGAKTHILYPYKGTPADEPR